MRELAKYSALVVIVYIILQLIVIPAMDEATMPAHIKAAMIEQELERIEEQRQLEAERLQRQRETQATLASILQSTLYAIATGVIIAILLALIILARYAWKPRIYHAQNGLYPIIERDRTPLLRRLKGEKDIAIANPNQFANPFSLMHIHRDGSVDVQNDAGGMTPEQLAQAHRAQSMAQMVQAGYRGRPDRPPNKWEVMERNGLLPQPKAPSLLPVPDDTETEPPMTLRDAIEQSSVDGGFIVGQDIETGKPAKWHLTKYPHAGILGSTGQGKTTGAASTVVLEAIKEGVHVVILDKEGSYWPVFKDHVEYVETGGEDIGWQLDYIAQYMDKVDAYMQRTGMSHFRHTRGGAPRVLVVVEEFADLCDEVQRFGGSAAFVRHMELFARRGSKYGINFMLISQHYDGWPKAVRQNVGFSLSYQQPVSDYSIAHYYEIDHLEPGEFAHKGRAYRAWDTTGELMAILAELPRFWYRRIIGEPPVQMHTAQPPPGQAQNGGSGLHTVQPVQRVQIDGLDENGKVPLVYADDNQADVWDALAVQFFAHFPDGTQGDLCRVIAEVDPLCREWTAFKGSLSMDLYHCYSPHGQASKIRTNKRREIRKNMPKQA